MLKVLSMLDRGNGRWIRLLVTERCEEGLILISREGMVKHLILLQVLFRDHYSRNNKYRGGTGRDCAWRSGKGLALNSVENFHIWQ